MSALVVALWMLTIMVDTGGQLAFKAAAIEPPPGEALAHWRFMARRPWIWLGVGCYAIEFLAWLAFLSLVPLSVGVLLGSINIVVIMLAGAWLFGERLDGMRVAGIALVSLGVAIVGAAG